MVVGERVSRDLLTVSVDCWIEANIRDYDYYDHAGYRRGNGARVVSSLEPLEVISLRKSLTKSRA